MAVLLETSKGDLVVDLFTDECPLATRNFLKLCKLAVNSQILSSPCFFHKVAADKHEFCQMPSPVCFPCRIKYYNNALFHNVQPHFIAQTGDPTGTGKGGDSVYGCVPHWLPTTQLLRRGMLEDPKHWLDVAVRHLYVRYVL